MSSVRERPPASRKKRPARRLGGALLAVAALCAAFALGIPVGEALHDNPAPGGTQSLVRTLTPRALTPAALTTVTVTAPAP